MTISRYEALLAKAKAEQGQKKGGAPFDEQMAKAKVNYYQNTLAAMRRVENARKGQK